MTGPRPGARLARFLTSRGAIQDPAWHRAVLAVDRAAFIPETVWVRDSGDPAVFRPYPRDTDPDIQRWIYEDYALMIQVDDGHPVGDDGSGRTPTSSISQPSLVVAMLEALDVAEGMRVLEVGTGTGYNCALLCERLGDENVTSVEVDEGVAEQARATLDRLGYKPRLLVADGAEPVDGEQFDRLLSTVAVRRIPPAWLSAVRPGGVIVTPWAPGPGFSSAVLVRLVVEETGAASGRIIGDAAFMLMRDHRYDAVGISAFVNEDAPSVTTGHTTVNPRWVSDRHPGWTVMLGHLVPGLGYASYEAAEDDFAAAGEASVFVVDRDGDSWALGEYVPQVGQDGYEAKRSGPRDLWAEIGAARAAWERTGRPGRDRLGLTITPNGTHRLWADEPGRVLSGRHAWRHQARPG
ncbi:methyltransferase domain-containing protein [Nocardiopsis rhodophaea]|uniref:Protein-L-isoaspartate O-methyltransferase n=1 Tax=Nocardiopsis rhodophaea TaxID=280238 RepID=A0ABN2SY06_9ACTN